MCDVVSNELSKFSGIENGRVKSCVSTSSIDIGNLQNISIINEMKCNIYYVTLRVICINVIRFVPLLKFKQTRTVKGKGMDILFWTKTNKTYLFSFQICYFMAKSENWNHCGVYTYIVHILNIISIFLCLISCSLSVQYVQYLTLDYSD